MQLKSPSERILVIFALLSTSLILWQSPIRAYLYGDSMGSLLTSQQLLKTGSPVIEQTEEELQAIGYSWQISAPKGDVLYAYPLGISYLSVPAVALANLIGYDMENIEDQANTQKALAILSLMGTMVLLHLIGRTFIHPNISLLITVAFTLGTTLASTLAVAYWNFNLELIFLTWSMLLITKAKEWKSPRTPTLVGLLLFLAFFCRPTSTPYIAVFLAYLGLQHRKHFLIAAAVSGLLFVTHTAFSIHYYGAITPGHHQFASLYFGERFAEGILGNTISPSRGLFVNSPLLIFAAIAPLCLWYKNKLQALDLFIFIGLFLHLLLISSWGMWWGGGSFTSRLCTDALPGYFYLLLRFFQALDFSDFRFFVRRPITGLAIATATAFGIFVHTTQGTLNPWTERYNIEPLIGPSETEHFFNWNFPQFLSSEKLLRKRKEYYFSKRQEAIFSELKDATGLDLSLGLDADSSRIYLYDGFHAPDKTGRWISDTKSTFYLKFPLKTSSSKLTLKIDAMYMGESEPVTIRVDNNDIKPIDLSKEPTIEFAPTVLDASKETHRFDILIDERESSLNYERKPNSHPLKLRLESIRLEQE